MPIPQKLTQQQKDRLRILEPKLRKAVLMGNYEHAKEITLEIQNLLRKTGHETRLMKAKNWLFEAALEAGDLSTAESGFIGIICKTNKATRVHLEAVTLLAIVYLRQGKLKEAEPLMREALRSDSVIKSERRKREFRINIIKRFEEEATIATLKLGLKERIDVKEIQDEAGKLLTMKNEDDIYEEIGRVSPPETKQMILKISEFARGQLPPADIKLLQSPQDRIKDKNVGITVFEAAKHVLWRSLCDPKSDIYQAWFKNGIGFVFSRVYLGSAVALALTDLGMGIKSFLVPMTALIIKFGLEVYCIRFKPAGIMLE